MMETVVGAFPGGGLLVVGGEALVCAVFPSPQTFCHTYADLPDHTTIPQHTPHAFPNCEPCDVLQMVDGVGPAPPPPFHAGTDPCPASSHTGRYSETVV